VKHQISSQNRFNEILNNPAQAKPHDVEQLLKAYPYSHILWFIEAKRHILHQGEESQNLLNSVSLYASSPEQLYSYLYAEPINDLAIHNQDKVAKLDLLLNQEHAEGNENLITNIMKSDNDAVDSEDITPLSAVEAETAPPLISIVSEADETHTREDVAKYDDELMPYTFVWWLHKTRLEYADTYQPYAPKTKPALKNLQGSISDIVLDQQIRENIFHLQSPEEKLSIKENKTITFKIPQKTDEIIERFIKEEPQIKPPQANKITLENKAKQSAEDQSVFVSETLAEIYVEQGLYHKAIDAYMKLSLKYPKKSVYFADRIKDLESKIN